VGRDSRRRRRQHLLVIESALGERAEALIALPGGKSPALIFERLAGAELDWNQVTIIPTDDRLVSMNSPMSNVAMIARYLKPSGARVLPLTAEGAVDYQMAGRSADVQLAKLKWPPDLVWLGVGADGHTASIFPAPILSQRSMVLRYARLLG
jgi:6-phosphogluconolactonase